MADAQVSPGSLWREAWKPVFRSRREKVGNFTYSLVVALLVVLPIAFFDPFGSVLSAICIALGVVVLQIGGWLVWLVWGRERFPRPANR